VDAEAREAAYTALLGPSPCRSGCKSQDHASYAECLKACNVQIGNLK
jgi:hypothetical protein